ncbi:anti-sigma factor [Erythrobacter sp. W53]|uniref:anti-sigma factor n=1 Tax=Erythrobacter sp. W53 TaxID=3425947 RepID=UPI003D769100
MSDDIPMTDDQRPDDVLAAEYALGLLEGEELLMVRGRIAREPVFAGQVEQWQARLAPMIDSVPAAQPPEDLLARVHAEIGVSGGETAEVITLKQRVRSWQIATTAAATAAIAALSIVVLSPAEVQMIEPPAQAPLVASVPIANTDLRLAVTYLPDQEELLISASGLTADGVHDHELWLVPGEGPLQSLGVVIPGEERKVAITPEVAAMFRDGSELLLTREPLGGKPEGVDAGPVVAEGQLQAV